VLDSVMGSYIEEYGKLWDYVEEIKTSNLGSTIILKSCVDNSNKINYFARFYVCFDTLRKRWLGGCKKILGIDGYFLKGICKGILLVAVGRNGNNQMFPIA